MPNSKVENQEISFEYNSNFKVSVKTAACGSKNVVIEDNDHNITLKLGEDEFASLRTALVG